MEIIPFSSAEHSLESYIIKVSSRSRIIYWILISSVIIILALLPLIYVDISVQARGFFQSDIERQIINAPFQGKVIYSSIQPGKKIERGDTLLIIDSETLKARREALEKRIDENNLSIEDLILLTKMDSASHIFSDPRLKSPRYSSEYASFRKQQMIQLQKLRRTIQEHERNFLLYKQNLIAQTDYETSQYAYNLENENLKVILISHRSSWQSDLTLRQNESARLEAELRQVDEELSNHIVISPVSGEIIISSGIQTGTLVAAGQNLVEISPEGELLATCFVKPSDIGLIYENQKVRVQVDAFNYNQWGMLKGSIIDISDDMIIENGTSAFFRVKCRLDDKYLSLKNGYSASMKKGMSLNARILVTQRSLFNLLFDKADKWLNPYMKQETVIANAD